MTSASQYPCQPTEPGPPTLRDRQAGAGARQPPAGSGVRQPSQQFDRFLSLLYGLVLMQSDWPMVLLGLAQLVGAVGAMIYTRPTAARRPSEILQGGLPDELLREYLRDQAQADPRLSLLSGLREGESAVDTALADHPRHRAFYEGFLGSYGLRYSLVGFLQEDAGRQSLVMLHYAGNVLPGPEQQAQLRRALPHLRNALDAQRRLVALDEKASSLMEALDGLALPFLVVDGAGHLQHCSRAAERVLGRTTALWRTAAVRGEKLGFAAPAVAEQWSAAVQQAAEGGRAPTLRLRDGEGRLALLISLVPLPPGRPDGPPPGVLVWLLEPQALPVGNGALLRRIYGLSQAEVRLVLDLAGGASLQQHASDRQISYETARTYLERAITKAGVANKSDLLWVVAALGALLPSL